MHEKRFIVLKLNEEYDVFECTGEEFKAFRSEPVAALESVFYSNAAAQEFILRRRFPEKFRMEPMPKTARAVAEILKSPGNAGTAGTPGLRVRRV